MNWWEGMDETRLLVSPISSGGGDAGRLLSLQHPKSGKATCYLLSNGMLQELHWFKQSCSSWFLGDYVSHDGCLYSATPVDPVFIFLPNFEEARMKKGDDPGKFRKLDEILFVNGYPGFRHLMPIAEKCMEVVCEVKEIGSLKFFRLDDSKVFAWLLCKVHQLKQALLALDKNYAAQDEKSTLVDAVMILGEYLKDEPWLKILCDHLKLEATRMVPDAEKLLPEAPSNLMQEKGKAKRSGKQAQAKKVKVETKSLNNIREMFSRASRRK